MYFKVLGIYKMGVLIIRGENFDNLIKMMVFENNAKKNPTEKSDF